MHDATQATFPPITDRQRQVVELIAAGCSNEEVGERLGISPRTAKAHADVLRRKLGVTAPTPNPGGVPGAHRERPPLPTPRASTRARGLTAARTCAPGVRRCGQPLLDGGLSPSYADRAGPAARHLAMNEGTQNPTGLADELRASQRHIIKRPRLTKLLDEADARVILLVAPAGYGKTTLAREWLGQRDRTALWYRARTGASSVAALARGLAQAVSPVSPGADKTVREFLVAHPEPDPELLAQVLAGEVGAWPSDCWLVIDEYELLIGNKALEGCVEALVKGSDARVLLAGRERPGWVGPRDVLYGDAFELRRASLAMTPNEGTEVLEHASHAPEGVVALANGWPAVIGLAALLSGDVGPDYDVKVALFDYLAQELFDDLDPVVQRHLVLLSVPSTLTTVLGAHHRRPGDRTRPPRFGSRGSDVDPRWTRTRDSPAVPVIPDSEVLGCWNCRQPDRRTRRAIDRGRAVGRRIRGHPKVRSRRTIPYSC